MKTNRNSNEIDNNNHNGNDNDNGNDNGVSGNDAIRKIHFYLQKEHGSADHIYIQDHDHGHGHGHGHDNDNYQTVTSASPIPITPSPYYPINAEDEDECSEIIPRRLPVPLSIPVNTNANANANANATTNRDANTYTNGNRNVNANTHDVRSTSGEGRQSRRHVHVRSHVHSQHQIEEKEDMPEEPRMPLHLQLPPDQNERNGCSHGQSLGYGQGNGNKESSQQIENIDGRLATMNQQQQYSAVEVEVDSSHEECEALRIENRQLRTILRDIGCSSLLPLQIHPNQGQDQDQGQNAMPSTMGDDASSSTYSSELSQSWLKNMNMNMHQQNKIMTSKTKTNVQTQPQMPLQMQVQMQMSQKIKRHASPQDGIILKDQHANSNSISNANKHSDTNTSIMEENSKLHSEIQSLQHQLQYEQSQSQILQQNMNSIHIAKNELWSDLNHAMDDRKRFVLRCDGLQIVALQSKKDMEDLRHLLHAKEDAIEKYKCEIQQLQDALGQRVEQIAKFEQQYDVTTQEMQSLQSTLDIHTQEKQAVTQERSILQQHLSNSKLHIQELQLKLSQSEHDTQEYQNATRDVKKELEAMTQLYEEERSRANLWGEQMKKLVRERAQMGTQLNLHEAHKRLSTPPSTGSSRRGERGSSHGTSTGAGNGNGTVTGVYTSWSSSKMQQSGQGYDMHIQTPPSSSSTGGKFKQSTDILVEKEEMKKARRTNKSMKCSQLTSSFGSRHSQRRAINIKHTASAPCKLSTPPTICMSMATSTPSTKGTRMSEVGSTRTMAMPPTPTAWLEEKQRALEKSLQELERESPSAKNASYQPTICSRYLTTSASASASNASSGLDVLSTCRKSAHALGTSVPTSLEFSKENRNPRASEGSKEHYASNGDRDHDHDLSLLDPPSALMKTKLKMPPDENSVGGDTVVKYHYQGSALEDADAALSHLVSVGDESLLDFLSQDDASTLI